MKPATRDIAALVKNMPPQYRAVLVYGPDTGLVRERSKIIAKQIVPDLNDPFNVCQLEDDVLGEDSARLSDEANAISLMGGKRLVRIADGGNFTAAALKTYLKAANPDCTIVIEAGNLGRESNLRKLCEAVDNAVAIPCYVEEERDLSGFIRDEMRAAGMMMDSEAIAYFAAAIKGDRARARMEVEKLLIYMGDEKKISLQDVQNSVGDAGTQSFDELVFFHAMKQKDLALRAAQRLQDEGMDIIAMLRVLQNHYWRVHSVKNIMLENNLATDMALKKLQPPAYFKAADALKAHAANLNMADVHLRLSRLAEIEGESKKTGTPVQSLFGRFLLQH